MFAFLGYVPKTVFWDSTEPKLFVCETKKMTIEKKNSMFKSESNSRTDVRNFFQLWMENWFYAN